MSCDLGPKLVREEKAALDAGGDWSSQEASDSYRSCWNLQLSFGQMM